MGLSPGTKLGPYEVIAPLGAGGMGEVYRARDTRLDRTVAVKVIPSHLSSDPVRRQRFEREARAISALQHPNICTLYDVGQQDGMDYLVMEYLEGVTLASRLGRGPLPLSEMLRYGTEIADALDTAHRRGIVHRDLKPGNILITARGECKVLDFGLAMLEEETPSAEAPTVTRPEVLTSPGVAMGTVAYMSPEQARGEALDARTDIFSLGAVLYEMATGKVAFGRKTSALVFKAILDETPMPVTRLNGKLPERLDEVIGKALEKDRDLRYQSAADLRTDLKRLARDSESAKYAAARPDAQKPKKSRWSGARVAAGIVVVLLAIAGLIGSILYHRSRSAAALTDKDTIVLADFTNSTGDSVFDDALKQGLSVQLEQSPFLELISDRRVNETLKLMGHTPGDRLTSELGREVCLRTGSKAMLSGSIAGLGSQYVIGLKAVNCQTGDVLAEEQEQATGKEAVLKALDSAAINLRTQLGESLSSVQKYATRLSAATTPSLEALQAYSLGQKTRHTKSETAALPFLQRAAELDPHFALPYATMSSIYGNLNQPARAAQYARKAYDLRGKVSELERLGIETNYYMNATGEMEKAAQVLELWHQTYPKGFDLCMDTAAIFMGLGDNEKALQQCLESPVNGTSPDIHYVHFVNLGAAYMNLNRLDEAEAVYKEAANRKLEGEILAINRYELAFLKSDAEQMAQVAATATGKASVEGLMLVAQAETEAWYGKMKNARELTLRAMDSARHNDATETAATFRAAAALREVESGYPEKARDDVEAAMKLSANRDVQELGALGLARAGDTRRAEKLAAELDKALPLDTLVQRYWLPSIRAAVALQRKDPNQAVELLNANSVIELSAGSFTAVQVALCPAYLRGEAYLMLRDGKHAAAEFQKFVDHRGLVGNFQWGVLARLGLARAYAMQDDAVRARAAYQDFLMLWKDADADVPILKQAKVESVKLQ